jgi:hypothetical protein
MALDKQRQDKNEIKCIQISLRYSEKLMWNLQEKYKRVSLENEFSAMLKSLVSNLTAAIDSILK